MLHIVFVESALEIVPPEIVRHPSVRRNAKRRGKRPEEALLNRSLHHAAMEGLPEAHKRGRPDIVNICLLEALGTPLSREGKLRAYVHTFGGYTIYVSPQARLPRDCNRFNSLVEQLFQEGSVPPGSSEPLMVIQKMGLGELLGEISPTRIVALTSRGDPSNMEDLCRALSAEENPMVLIGAFPHGPMEEETLSHADDVVSIYPEALEAWVVTSRLIYEFERALRR
ncbi:MAG: 16S rRNA methyltransferase [Candidatus Bathyarchaeota archaeon]|nr:16S rRNA methyltransferase [Candidatus Bathyarchaeota archaeon]